MISQKIRRKRFARPVVEGKLPLLRWGNFLYVANVHSDFDVSIHSDFILIETDQTFYFYTVNYNTKSVINCFISGSKVPNTSFFFFRSENPCSSGSLILEAPSKHVFPYPFSYLKPKNCTGDGSPNR